MDIFFNNILSNGSIIASPSKEPDYNYHWMRDSAIVMKAIMTLYIDTKDINQQNKLIDIMNKYIDIELIHINHHPAEPKFEIDGSPYLGDWGRPQNDGPALRGLVCIKLLSYLPERQKDLHKIISNDINYTLSVLDDPSFDLWEEQDGFHLYTRLLQAKFINDCFKVNYQSSYDLDNMLIRITELVSHHFSLDGKIYSSFNKNGHVLREYDSSVLLALCHIDYQIPTYVEKTLNISLHTFKNYANEMVKEFTEIYPVNNILKIPFLGRYYEDKYFDGNPWIISTIAYFHYQQQINNLSSVVKEFKTFFHFLKDIKKMDLPEQIDKYDANNISVEKLTWNYSELILFFKDLKKMDITEMISIF